MWMSCFSKNSSLIPSFSALDFTQLKAACIDSRITSPSWPVMVNPPLPFIAVASTNRMSPPAGVHASPTTTPARLVRSAISVSTRTFSPPSISWMVWAGTTSLSFFPSKNEITEGDVHLLFFGVTLQVDDLHAVAQRFRNRLQLVGRGNEEHLAQVERHVEVVIAERVVLFRIERLQQRRRRIATEVAADLIDLVEHEDRVVGFRPPHALHDL